jgi:signal transduction histidine kinase
MTLRTRFFALFTLLAVIPLVAVGAFGYVRSMRAVESLVATQVGEIARSAARELQDRYALHEANLLLLAQNAETQGLLQALATGDPSAVATARATALPYLETAWRVLGAQYEWIELRDGDGRIFHRMGDDPGAVTAAPGVPASSGSSGWLRLQEPIFDNEHSRQVGTVTAGVIPDAMLPYEALERRFGASGYSVVFDRSTGRVLYHPRHAYWQRSIGEVAGPAGWDIELSVFERPEGSITYREADSTRVAVFQSLDSPEWTVLASGSVDEFGTPFVHARAANLLLILSLTIAVWIAYALMARRATRSLAALTDAADRVGAGNFAPDLPRAGGDEVGRLTTAFRLMMAKVRESLQQIEASRQMAAVGQFASQISHEIRNPLTSLQLNLQGLKRDVERGTIPAESARPVELCLKEIHRLEGVVSGVLQLGRPHATETRACSLHGVIGDALDVLRAQLEKAGVEIHPSLQASADSVLGDAEALKSVFLNLFVNAADAMPSGGNLCVATESIDSPGSRARVRVRVEDDGVGISPEVREEIFKPFFSTKKGGTGLGLSLAARIVEEHRGDLKLAEPVHSSRGTAFVIELPVASEEQDT